MRKILITSVCLFLIVLEAWTQNKTISGKVTDDKTGNPLAGVSVTVKGTPGGTQTDPDGSFSLLLPLPALLFFLLLVMPAKKLISETAIF